MTAHPDEPPAHPLRRRDEDDPPPPRREQLPLPRRSRQGHLDPQLRVPGGRGDGTPFTAFAAPGAGPGPDVPADRAAAFHEGTARGRRPASRSGVGDSDPPQSNPARGDPTGGDPAGDRAAG